MDQHSIRKQSLIIAGDLGYTISQHLPVLDDTAIVRSREEVIARVLCLHALAATAYGFDRTQSRFWLEREHLLETMTDPERGFIEQGVGDPYIFKVQVEGIWALLWSLQIIGNLDFDAPCDDHMCDMLPDLRLLESSRSFREVARLRESNDVAAACDLSYCLHWAKVEARFQSTPSPGKVHEYVVVERRRALEWLLCNDLWDDVPMDT